MAEALFRLTARGGGIGASIQNIENFEEELSDNDVNDHLEVEAFVQEMEMDWLKIKRKNYSIHREEIKLREYFVWIPDYVSPSNTPNKQKKHKNIYRVLFLLIRLIRNGLGGILGTQPYSTP